MQKRYKLGFDVWGLLLFLIIMLPNFIWFAVPAPNDILRTDSNTKILDTVASVCQVWMVIVLCIIQNHQCKKLRMTPLVGITMICYLLYIVSWIAYYSGIVSSVVIWGLIIPPCVAFMVFAIDRKNWPAIIPISIFTVCHLVYGAVNFII